MTAVDLSSQSNPLEFKSPAATNMVLHVPSAMYFDATESEKTLPGHPPVRISKANAFFAPIFFWIITLVAGLM